MSPPPDEPGTRSIAGVRHNEGMVAPPPPTPRSGRPHRLLRAVFQPIGDEGRATLVERRIAEAIMGGVLHAGERLPAETDLAQSFGVAPATAREALLGLRERGLITTRRGRNGGSFVADSADPATFARDALVTTSRVALRDAATHYGTITAAAVELAARRADPSEISMIRQRHQRVDAHDLRAWRRISDDAQIELSALSQSARLTREHMRLQAELSPLLALADRDPERREASRSQFAAVLDAVESGDADTAVALSRQTVRETVEWLIDLRETLLPA